MKVAFSNLRGNYDDQDQELPETQNSSDKDLIEDGQNPPKVTGNSQNEEMQHQSQEEQKLQNQPIFIDKVHF